MDDNKLPKKINYKPKKRWNIEDHKRDEKVISGRKRPRGLSLIVDDDEINNKYTVYVHKNFSSDWERPLWE